MSSLESQDYPISIPHFNEIYFLSSVSAYISEVKEKNLK